MKMLKIITKAIGLFTGYGALFGLIFVFSLVCVYTVMIPLQQVSQLSNATSAIHPLLQINFQRLFAGAVSVMLAELAIFVIVVMPFHIIAVPRFMSIATEGKVLQWVLRGGLGIWIVLSLLLFTSEQQFTLLTEVISFVALFTVLFKPNFHKVELRKQAPEETEEDEVVGDTDKR